MTTNKKIEKRGVTRHAPTVNLPHQERKLWNICFGLRPEKTKLIDAVSRGRDISRSEWIREAIDEKLAREVDGSFDAKKRRRLAQGWGR